MRESDLIALIWTIGNISTDEAATFVMLLPLSLRRECMRQLRLWLGVWEEERRGPLMRGALRSRARSEERIKQKRVANLPICRAHGCMDIRIPIRTSVQEFSPMLKKL